MQFKMTRENNFICNKCGRKLNLLEILKLSFGPEMKFICKCSNGMKFEENRVLKYLPVLFAASIVFIKGNMYTYFIYFSVLFILIFLYFTSVKKVESK